MRKFLLGALLLFPASFMPGGPCFAQAYPGNPCFHIGETTITSDYHYIVACLSTKTDGAGNDIPPANTNDCGGGTTCYWQTQTDASPGVVEAFNNAACPQGWWPASYLSGRLALASGDSGTTGSSNHGFGSSGGNETHTLGGDELYPQPNTADAITLTSNAYYIDHMSQAGWPSGANKDFYRASFNNSGTQVGMPLMNPYYVVTYCEKR